MERKLLNFTICQIFVVIGMLASCVKCQEQEMLATENVTLFDRSFKKVLSRRKRFLLWRPGSNVLLTGSLVKPLAFPRPGGHNLLLEWDIFYPLPSTWHTPPKKPLPPPPPPPPTTTIPPPEEIESWDHHEAHSGEIWMPPGGWTSDVVKNLASGEEKTGERRYWNSLRRPQVRRTDSFRPASSSPVTQYRNPLLYNDNNQPWRRQPPQTNSFARNKQINFNQQYYQSKRQSSPPSSSFQKTFIATNKQRQMNVVPRGRSLDLRDDKNVTQSESTDDDDWEHHQAHRDRRDLYSRLESAMQSSPFDIKSCLLRTICEAQRFLHPPGYSMLQDMLRVIFTVPIKDNMDHDDYSRAMQGDDQDCLRAYNQKCPMSILAFILQLKN